MKRRTCGPCAFYWPMDGISPAGDVGYCTVEPPKAAAAMNVSPLSAPGKPMGQQSIQGIDPPVRRDRPACRQYVPLVADA